ncbi:hypothetical protein ALP8811_01492 [Aliiroseovarius pelagivivens]|uniref:Uncharacterized protein n=1 Tax=Aliiroseovarius pelagivivens TaxID=1639690 RepID=A0A2R8AKC0_9RHOB|nr:hypothetical protein [Aliiroseovarius pelagivivens]SPF76485.1 hypothetical protein ALP8811_01492 [Aliiroseovarius pelagivivens]
MNNFKWIKPGIYGFVVGAITVPIIGFSWGGWIRTGTADKAAIAFANGEVTRSMVPVCLEMAASDPQRLAKLTGLQAAEGFTRRNAMMATGWATIPGSDTPDRKLADACIERLDLDAS